MVDFREKTRVYCRSASSITYLFNDFCRMKSKIDGQHYRPHTQCHILHKIYSFRSLFILCTSFTHNHLFIFSFFFSLSNRTSQHQKNSPNCYYFLPVALHSNYVQCLGLLFFNLLFQNIFFLFLLLLMMMQFYNFKYKMKNLRKRRFIILFYFFLSLFFKFFFVIFYFV